MTDIEVGQTWALVGSSRLVEVLEVDPGINEPGSNGFVTIMGRRRSVVRAKRFRAVYRLMDDGDGHLG